MFRMLIDTCVWLDLAKDRRKLPVLGVVEEMVKLGLLALIVPRVELDEFARNRERIAKESAKSLSTHFRVVKDAVGKLGGAKKRIRLILSHLDDVDHKIPIIGGAAVSTLDRIEKLLTASNIIEASDEVRLRAAQRAIEKKAPFHRGKNSMADAILIETYADCVRDKKTAGVRFAFVPTTRAISASNTAIRKRRIRTSPASSRGSSLYTSSICLKPCAALNRPSSRISCLSTLGRKIPAA